ncbi:MAG: hypothetical protein EOM83_13550 [Clostridia bacterium]|nr:hypothetical protein [Clostridia bacterium]
MRVNLKLAISLFLIFCSITIVGQDFSKPKKIKAKGNYIHRPTMTIFPESFDSFQRKNIYSFEKDKTNIGVTYENQQLQAQFSIYVYPAGEGVEGRLRNEYQKSMQSMANLSENGILATQFAVRKEGEKYTCNGFKAIVAPEENRYNSLTLYECGQWYLKVRITAYHLDTNQIASLEQKIYSKFDPTKLTATAPLGTKVTVYYSKAAFRDSVLLGSAMGSALKKIEWAEEHVKESERASGFPDLYLTLQVESLKAFMEFQHRFNYKKSDFTKEYLNELQLISAAGFLAELIMDQLGMILIMPEDTPSKFEEYEKWKQSNKITIDLNQRFYLISYGQDK